MLAEPALLIGLAALSVHTGSISLSGMLARLGLCFLIGSRLSASMVVETGLLVPVALFTTVTGLLVIVSRRKAVTQVLGYLGMENGIYAFGMALRA